MACKRYTITNNTNKIGTYSYQECSELIYVNDSQIRPGQTKNIWARDNTFNVSEFLQLEIVVENFPDTQANTGPCSYYCYPALLWYNDGLNKTSQSIYDWDTNVQFIADPYYPAGSPQSVTSNSTIIKYRPYIDQVTNLGTTLNFQNYGPYRDCPFQVFNGVGNTNKNYFFPSRPNLKITYGITEETWLAEDPVAKQVVYLTGTTVTAQTPSNLIEQYSWNFPVGMDKVVGQIKTFFAYGGTPRVWTMYQNTLGRYALVRNLFAQPNTQEFSYNLPSNFTVNGERPIGIWLTPFQNVLFYTNYHNVYEFNTTTSSLSFLQAAPNPFQSFQPGWTPIWLGQPWTCDIPPASPTPTNTPTQTQTPTFTPTQTPTQTITPTTTKTPTPTATVTNTPTNAISFDNCVVFFTNNVYVFSSNTTTSLTLLGNGLDIANTTSKLWTYEGYATPPTSIYEYDLTLSPFSYTLNRTITLPSTSLGAGLTAISNTKLISTAGASSSQIIEIDITTSTGVVTPKFNITGVIAGDIILTTSNILYVTTTDGYLRGYDYSTGSLTLSFDMSPFMPTGSALGIFVNDNNLYVAQSNGNIWLFDSASPYSLSLIQNAGVGISGASSAPECETFTPVTPTPTPTPTITSTPVPVTPTSTSTPTGTPNVTSTVTPTSTEGTTPTPTPTATCVLDQCYQFVSVEITGETRVQLTECGSLALYTRTLTASTYPDTVRFRWEFCFEKDSLVVLSGSTPVSVVYDTDCCGTPVTPTPTSTETPTPTTTPTVTPSTSEVPVSPTPTSTESITPTPTPTCAYSNLSGYSCFHYAAVTLSGATQMRFDLCFDGNTTSPRTLTASTYPSTVLLGPTFQADCFVLDSYQVLSGSTPIAVEYFNPCCEPVSSCDGCYEYLIDGGFGSGSTWNVSYCSGGTENLLVPGYSYVNVCVTERPYKVSGSGGLTLIDCCGTPVTPTPTPTSSGIPVTPTSTPTSTEGTTPTPTPTPTCVLDQCYQFVSVEITGATSVYLTSCDGLYTHGRTLTASTYPDTVRFRFEFCFEKDSLVVVSGSTPVSVVYDTDCCLPVSPTPTPTSTVTPTVTSSEGTTPTPTSSEVPVTPTPTSTEVPVTPTPTSTPTSTEVPVTPTPTSTPCSCMEYTAISETDEGGSVEYLDCNGISAVQNVRPFSLVTFCACSIVSQTGNVDLTENRECSPITPTPTNTSTNTPTPTSSASVLVTPTPTLTPTPTGCDPFSGGSITNTTLDSPTYSVGYVQFGYVDGGVNQPSGASIKGSGTLPTAAGGLSSGTVCETDGYVFVQANSYGGNPTGVATVITVNLNGSFLGQVQGPFQGSGLPPVTETFSYTRVPGDSIEVIWDSITSGATPTPTVTSTVTPTVTPTNSGVPVTPTPTVTSTATPTLTPTESGLPPTATPTSTVTPTNTVTPSSTPPCACTTYELENTGAGLANYSYTNCNGGTVSGSLEGFQTTSVCACSVGPVDPNITVVDTLVECAVESYSFTLIQEPYELPASGKSIMNNEPLTFGSTDPNLLDDTGRGFYFNTFDSDGIDRTSYFSSFTGQSVTITLSQTGSTAIYSGDTNSFKYWSTTGGTTGFVFGTGIGVPPVGTPSGVAILVQSADTQWVSGVSVYVTVSINTPPTPTPTNTVTPTSTPTSTVTETPSNTPTNTPTQTPTNTETPTQTPTNTETPTNTPTNTVTVTPTTTPSPTPVFVLSGSNQSTTVYVYQFDFDSGISPNTLEAPDTTAYLSPSEDKSFLLNSLYWGTGTFSFQYTNLQNPGTQARVLIRDSADVDYCVDTNTSDSIHTYTITGFTLNGTNQALLLIEDGPCEEPTPTVTPTSTSAPTPAPTQSPSETPTNTPTNTPSQTPTNTVTQTNTPSNTETPTNTPTQTPTNTVTPTSSTTQFLKSFLNSVDLVDDKSYVLNAFGFVSFANNPSSVPEIICDSSNPSNLVVAYGSNYYYDVLEVGGTVTQTNGFGVGSTVFVSTVPPMKINTFYDEMISYGTDYAKITTTNSVISSIETFTNCVPRTVSYLILSTDVYGDFQNNLGGAVDSFNCMTGETCFEQGVASGVWLSGTPVQVGDTLYSSSDPFNNSVYAYSPITGGTINPTGYYIINYSGAPQQILLTSNGVVIDLIDPNTPITPTPTSTPTVTPTSSTIPATPTSTSTPTVTPTSSTIPATPTSTSTPAVTPTSSTPVIGFSVSVKQVDEDVVWSGSGSFNLTDLVEVDSLPVTGGYDNNSAAFGVGPVPPTTINYTRYSGSTFTTYPSSFGSGSGTSPSSFVGDGFGIFSDGIDPGATRFIAVPEGYVSGTVISGSMIFAATTLETMGLTNGTYVYEWGSEPNIGTLTLIIGG